MIMLDVESMKLMSDEACHNLIVDQYIQYMSPSKFRSKMPGYEQTFDLINVNTKMAQKIIKTRAVATDNMSSIGGASGITSMLARGKLNQKTHMTYQE